MKQKIHALIFFTILVILSYILYPKFEDKRLGGNFSATHVSSNWQFEENAKKLNLLYFGFVRCPDVCPLAMVALKKAYSQLDPKEASKIQVIFVGVNFYEESPQEVSDFAKSFNENFIGLSSEEENLREITRLVGASFMLQRDEETSKVSVMHSDRLFFLDKKGKVETTLLNPSNSDEIVRLIRELL